MWQAISDWADDNRDTLVILAALALVAAGASLARRAEPVARETALQPVILIATPTAAAPTPPATPTVSGPALARAIVAYDAPGGTVLGAIEPGRSYSVVARSGAEWLLLDVVGSGQVWARAAEVAPEIAHAPDIATAVPPPAPQIIVVSAPQAPAAEEVPALMSEPSASWPMGPHSTGRTCLELPGGCRVDLGP